jgi:hypothetical protein
MSEPFKNIKIGKKHHEMLKEYCDKNGIKIYRAVEKWIEEIVKQNTKTDSSKKRDLYGD